MSLGDSHRGGGRLRDRADHHQSVNKLRELSPLYDMHNEGIDITKIEWQAH
jgi:hypothetical protein